MGFPDNGSEAHHLIPSHGTERQCWQLYERKSSTLWRCRQSGKFHKKTRGSHPPRSGAHYARTICAASAGTGAGGRRWTRVSKEPRRRARSCVSGYREPEIWPRSAGCVCRKKLFRDPVRAYTGWRPRDDEKSPIGRRGHQYSTKSPSEHRRNIQTVEIYSGGTYNAFLFRTTHISL